MAFLDGEYIQQDGFFRHENNHPARSSIFLYYEDQVFSLVTRRSRWVIVSGDGLILARSKAGVSRAAPPQTGWSFCGRSLPWWREWSPQIDSIRLSPISWPSYESVETMRLKVVELQYQLTTERRSNSLLIESLQSDANSSKDAYRRARDELTYRDVEIDQVQLQLIESQQRLSDVLKARGLHDTRSTLDSHFPNALEMMQDIKCTAIEQSLKSLVQCLRLDFRAQPSSILMVLKHLFEACISLVDDRFQSFNLHSLITESTKQQETLECTLLRAREILLGLPDLAAHDLRRAALSEVLGIDWEEWDAIFDEEELRNDVSRWYLDVCSKTVVFEIDRRLCGVVQVDWSTVGQLCPKDDLPTSNSICKNRQGETSRYIVYPRLTCTDPAFSGKSVGAYVMGCREAAEDISSLLKTFSNATDLWKHVLGNQLLPVVTTDNT